MKNLIRIEIDTADGKRNIVLPPSLSLRVETNSSLFSTDTIPGNKVYSFNIPVNDINRDIFKHPDALILNGKVRLYTCSYYLAGNLFFSGKLVLGKITNKQYPAQIVINPFAVDFSSLNISELIDEEFDLGADADAIVSSCNNIITRDYPSVKFQFPCIYNPDFYGDTNTDFDEIVNRFGMTSQTFYENTISIIAGADNKFNLVPQPYLIHVLKSIFKFVDYKILGDVFEHELIQKLLLYSNFALDKTNYFKHFVKVDQLVLYSVYKYYLADILLPIDRIIEDDDNNYDLHFSMYEIGNIGYHEINVRYYIDFENYSNVTKLKIRVKNFAGDTLESYDYFDFIDGYNFFSDNFTLYFGASDIGDKIYLSLYLWTDGELIGTVKIKETQITFINTSLRDLNRYDGVFNLNQILPEISTSDYINSFKDMFAIGVFFNFRDKEVSFEFAQNILSSNFYVELDDYINIDIENELSDESGQTYNYIWGGDALVENNFKSIDKTVEYLDTYEDLENVYDVDKLYHIKNSGNYYLAKKDEDYNYIIFSDDFYPKIIGDGKNSIFPKFGAMLMRWIASGFYYFFPSVSQAGSSVAFDTGINPPDLKLMIWHGKQPEINGRLFPFASSLNYDAQGTRISDYTLQWEGTYGIYEKFHKSWNTFLKNSERVRVKAYLPVDVYFQVNELLSSQNVPDGEKVRKIRFRGINFIPEKISGIHKNNSDIIQTEIIMRKYGNIEL